MKNFENRFDEMLDFIGITAYKLSKEIDTSESVISSIRAGKTKPSFDFLNKLLSKYEALNINYLINGKGKLVLNNASTPRQKTESIPLNDGISSPPGSVIVGKSSPNSSPTASPTRKKALELTQKLYDENLKKESIYGARTPTIVTLNEHGIDNILYVPVKAQAGYLMGYADKEYIETLPSFRMPGLGNNSYRMFEVQGVSMAPTLSDKDRVIAEWVPNIAEIRENRVHVVIHKDGVAIKRVLNRVKERGILYLKSDTLTHRQDFPIKEIDPADVIEVWYVRLKVSGDLSEPSEIYTRVADLELNMHEVMKKLGGKK